MDRKRSVSLINITSSLGTQAVQLLLTEMGKLTFTFYSVIRSGNLRTERALVQPSCFTDEETDPERLFNSLLKYQLVMKKFIVKVKIK